ncbi:MAG: leucyl aminopeptidase [Bacteroidales bacterium]|nr:leucyl aminopeptidase [Bacteroidales bacterium]
MKIFKAGNDEGFNNRIIIGDEQADFTAYIHDKSKHSLIHQRVAAEKDVTIIHDTNNTVFIQVLRNKGTSYHAELERARIAANTLYKHLKDHDATSVIIINNGVNHEELTAFLEGLYLTDYRFNKYLTKQRKDDFKLNEVGLLSERISEQDLLYLVASLEGTVLSRNLVNEPLSYLTAEKFAEEITSMGRDAGYTTEVYNKKKIESLRMGGLLAVNKGSIDPPTFSVLEWKPSDAINDKPYVLVGKGVVYDTGGLSLKPTHDSMDYMKCDMAGAAAVAGAFYAIAKSGLPVHIIGLIPATDNRPDGNAYVPGDVVEMYDGSTVEVLNTDAEGRMILADALSYAKQYDPELVIELSTLTGSAHAAVGKYAIVGMGNAEQTVMEELKEAGFKTFERIAEFPFWDDFSELLKSDIADQKNIGGKYAGAITAGKFLEKFTDYPYIHLDIAGPSFNNTEDKYRGKGGSGVGVRLLFEYFKKKSV